jgi:hypothetical protein
MRFCSPCSTSQALSATLLLGAALSACQLGSPGSASAPSARRDTLRRPIEQTPASGNGEEAAKRVQGRTGGIASKQKGSPISVASSSAEGFAVPTSHRCGRHRAVSVRPGERARIGRRSGTRRLPQPPNYTPEQLDYARDVFLGTDDPVISKWEKDLRFYVQGCPTRQSVGTLLRALRTAAHHAGLDVSFAREKRHANVTVTFASLAAIEERFGDYTGYTALDWGRRAGAVESAEVWIGYAHDMNRQAANSVTYHEVGHLFGLSHTQGHPSSVMARTGFSTQEFTRADLLGLRMLYQPEVEAGMTGEEAVEALR